MTEQIRLRFDEASLAPAMLMPWIVRFKQTYPSISLEFLGSTRHSIEADLIAGHIHAALGHELASNEFVLTIPGGQLRYIAVAAPSCLEQLPQKPETVDEVLALPTIDTAPSAPKRAQWLGAVSPSTEGNAAMPGLIVPDLSTALEAARAGAGVAFVPDRMAAKALAAGEVCELVSSKDAPSMPLVFAYRKKNSRPLMESVFLEFMMEELGSGA